LMFFTSRSVTRLHTVSFTSRFVKYFYV
jgi:hypothetical protein